jgi:hypothetical protein
MAVNTTTSDQGSTVHTCTRGHGELPEAEVYTYPNGKHACRKCERETAANYRKNKSDGTPRRTTRATAPAAKLTGPNREAALLMVEALDTVRNAIENKDGKAREGESPVARANRMQRRAAAALEAVQAMLSEAVEQSNLAGLLNDVAPVAAAVEGSSQAA